MENESQLVPLMTEIRDLVKEQTDLYREMARKAEETQEHANATLAANRRLTRRAQIFVLVVFALLIVYLVLDMVR